MRRHVALAIMALAPACIPSDTSAPKGGLAITFSPSPATRAGAFRTEDGWDVVLDGAQGFFYATVNDCNGRDSTLDFDSYGGGGYGYIEARAGGLLEVRAIRSSADCKLALEPQSSYISADEEAPPGRRPLTDGYAFRLEGKGTLSIGPRAGTTLRFDIQLRSIPFAGGLAKKTVVIPANDKSDVSVELGVERLFVTTEASRVSFNALWEADANHDGTLTTSELEDYRSDEDAGSFVNSVPMAVFATRLANIVRFP